MNEQLLKQLGFIKEDGFVDIQSAGTVSVAGLDAYYSTQFIDRYGYARPNTELQSLVNKTEDK